MLKRKTLLEKTAYLIPALVLMTVFFVGPVILSLYYSLTNLALTGSNASNLQFIWFDNYKNMFRDPAVIRAIFNTIWFVLGSVVGQTVIGFAVAYLMRSCKKGFRRVVGGVVMLGWIMPEMVAAYCMSSMFQDAGTLNTILSAFHLEGISWLYELPMFSVIVANIWRGTAFSMLAYQAALDDVSSEIEESARLDGVNWFQHITHIVLPSIRGTIMTNTMLITLMGLGCFSLIWLITGGGPSGKTQTLPLLMYIKAFKNSQMGYGVAISVVSLVIGVIFGLLYVRVAGKEE